MIHAIIVEDEQKIAVLIQALGDWSRFHIHIDAVFGDGQEALAYIKANQPDLVITDIKMPRLDGIQLVSAVMEEEIQCDFIIISGHRQFDYAVTALRYGITEYLLKPIGEDDLNGALARIVDNRAKRQVTTQLSAARLRTLRDVFMEQVLSGEVTYALQHASNKFMLSLAEGQYRCLFFRLDGDREVLIGCIGGLISTVREHLEPICFEVLPYSAWDNTAYVLLNYDSGHSEEFLQGRFDALLAKLEEKLPTRVVLSGGVGAATPDFSALSHCFETARQAFSHRMTGGCGVFYRYGAYPIALIPLDGLFTLTDQKRFLRAVGSYQFEEAAHIITTVLGAIPIHTEAAAIVECCNTIVDVVMEATEGAEEDEITQRLRTKLWEQPSLEQLQIVLVRWLGDVLARMQHSKKELSRRPIAVATQYINEHLTQPISLEEVAAVVELNPSYLSALFKRETGQNFSEYIIMLRINRAKRLLVESNCPVSDIAYQVGYADVKYFSRIFAKYAGITPSSYRKMH